MPDKIITHPQSETYRRGYDAIDWTDCDSMDRADTRDMPDVSDRLNQTDMPIPEDADAYPA